MRQLSPAVDGLSLAAPADPRYFGARVEIARRQPGFVEALLAATTAATGQFRSQRILNRFSNDRGRFVLLTLLLYLHFDGDPLDAPSGFTVGQVKTLCQEQDICSSGRATALLAGLQLIGLLHRLPVSDRRITRLAPSRHLHDLYRQRWQAIYGALAPLVPWSAAVQLLLPHDAFLGAMACEIARHFLAGFRALDAAPELTALAERDAGLIIAFSLLHARLGVDDPAHMTVAELARRFAVSRGHVLTLLRTGEDCGLFIRDGETGLFSGTDALENALANFFANAFVLQGEASRAALTAVAGLPGLPEPGEISTRGFALWETAAS